VQTFVTSGGRYLPLRDALKVLPAEVSADNDFRDRFNREADLAVAHLHLHIVGVHDKNVRTSFGDGVF
jgi:hypothetical protein